jgi:hypothetical protein
MRLAPHTDRMKIISWEGEALPNPPTDVGLGKPGFPSPLREGYALPDPPAGGGVGKPGFPTPLAEGVCSR